MSAYLLALIRLILCNCCYALARVIKINLNTNNMDYRIIAETEASGVKWYYVQKTYLTYFWRYVREVRDITMYKYKIGFKSIDEANLFIQSEVNFEYAKSQKKIVKRELI